jgi:hypothetical protein
MGQLDEFMAKIEIRFVALEKFVKQCHEQVSDELSQLLGRVVTIERTILQAENKNEESQAVENVPEKKIADMDSPGKAEVCANHRQCDFCGRSGHVKSRCWRYHRSQRGKCYCCGRLGHLALNCRLRDKMCYVCSEKGHFSRMCPKRQSSHAAAKSQVSSSSRTLPNRPVPKENSVLMKACADSMSAPKERESAKLTVNYIDRAAQTEARREVKSVKQAYCAFQNAFLSCRASERVYLQEFNMVTPRPGQGLDDYLRYLSAFFHVLQENIRARHCVQVPQCNRNLLWRNLQGTEQRI